ncbi:MAG: hypothetical protein ACKOC8_04470 [Pirellulales bacterium]
MSNHHAVPVSTKAAPPPVRSGITLLEVLVACGILVVGLASLASVLPAASARLAEASMADRAAVAAANAYAECVNRRLVAADVFTSVTTACAFGKGLENIVPDPPGKRRGKNKPQIDASIAQPSAALSARIDEDRGFLLEDDLTFSPPTSAETPTNVFISPTSGPRAYRDGFCWGAMLSPVSGTAASGAEAALSIAVFRKDSDSPAKLTLTQQSGPLFFVTASDSSSTESARKRMMPGCGYVIALPAAAPTMPRWVRVTSSWNSNPNDPANGQPSVVLDLDMLGESAKYLNGKTMTVIGFENLVRVDTYNVSLD